MKRVLMVFLVMLLSGCASNKIFWSHADPSFSERIKEPVLIIGIAHRETVRKLYEDALVDSFGEKNISCIAGYKMMEQKGLVKHADIIEAVKQSEVASVLVTRLEDVNNSTTYSLASGKMYDTLDGLEQNALFFNPHPQVTNSQTTKMQLQSRLYDVESRKLIWSATSESKNPVMTKKYIKNLTDVTVKDIKKSGLL